MDTPAQSLTVSSFLGQFLDSLPRTFRRKSGQLSPRIVVTLILNLVRGHGSGYAATMETMDEILEQAMLDMDRLPTPSALSKARAKLSTDFFMNLFAQLVNGFSAQSRHPLLRYHDFHLLAIDGTNVVLPNDKRLVSAFGQITKQQVPQATVVTLMDLQSNAPIDFTIGPCGGDERAALRTLCRSLGPGDLLIADRGYPSTDIFHALRETGADYIIRMTKNGFSATKRFIESGERQAIITLPPSTNRCPQHANKEPLTVRLIREENVVPGEDPRLFVTSLLDRDVYHIDDLAFLYTRRWAIETRFREMKDWFDLEKIHARTPLGVHQEIIAVMMNQVIAAECEERIRQHYDCQPQAVIHTKRAATETEPAISVALRDAEEIPYRFNRKIIMNMANRTLVYLLLGQEERARRRLRRSLDYLWRLKTKPRPGRSTPRMPKSPNAKQKNVRNAALKKKRKKAEKTKTKDL